MISPKSLMKIAVTASVAAITVSVAVVPACAMQDIAIEDTPSSFAATVDDAQNSSNSMPDNPERDAAGNGKRKHFGRFHCGFRRTLRLRRKVMYRTLRPAKP